MNDVIVCFWLRNYVRKCGRWADHFRTGARDVARELQAVGPADGSGGGWEVIDREPTPAEVALLTETVERVLQGLDDREQLAVSLALQGYAVAEIAGQVECTQSKVYRLLKVIRQRLERFRDENDDCP